MINYTNFHYIHRIAKRTKPILKKKNRFTETFFREKNDFANRHISELIKSEKPFMVARYGSIEIRAIENFLLNKKKISNIFGILKYLKGEIGVFWHEEDSFYSSLNNNAGFFPVTQPMIEKFVSLMLECSKDLDVLAIWNELEEFIETIPKETELVKIREIEPWFYQQPWSMHLEGKKVLIIHPFEATIKKQYLNRQNIYLNQKVLPEFELRTIKAVQTIAGEKSRFNNWFEALDYMKREIDKTDFDIAIIGCGAYGFPLASYVKNIGKQAIHLGGVTQLLFGIKGKRWEDWDHYTSLRGDAWTTTEERPENYQSIEGGCYW